MDHWFNQLSIAFVFIDVNVKNCCSPCTVMKATDIVLLGLLNRSLTMCRTESSVLWVILAKSSCCLVLDVCVSEFPCVQRPPPSTEQTWAPAADWGALILLIHLGMQRFAITFNIPKFGATEGNFWKVKPCIFNHQNLKWLYSSVLKASFYPWYWTCLWSAGSE